MLEWDGYKLSGSFPEYALQATKDIPFEYKGKQYSVPKGTVVPYINPTAKSRADVGAEITFEQKELTPDTLGLSAQTYDSAQALVQATTAAIDKKYADRPEVSKPLKDLLEDALNAKGNRIDLRDALVFGRADLATISKDFGEILAAMWIVTGKPPVDQHTFYR